VVRERHALHEIDDLVRSEVVDVGRPALLCLSDPFALGCDDLLLDGQLGVEVCEQPG
jgi:hypothetical protein